MSKVLRGLSLARGMTVLERHCYAPALSLRSPRHPTQTEIGHARVLGRCPGGLGAPASGLPAALSSGHGLANHALLSDRVWSPTDVWAVGEASLTRSPGSAALTGAKTLVEHWDGHQWSVIASPSPGLHSSLSAITLLSATDAWAVGSTWDDLTQTMQTLIEHWDGHSWQRLSSPNDADAYWSELAAVTAHSPTDVWAVGDTKRFGSERPLIEHWDGHAWQLVPSPFPPQMTVSQLSGVVALSASDAWAVGSSQTAVESSDGAPLVEHWDGQRWALVASAPGSRPRGALAALGAVSPRNIWAVGGRRNPGSEAPLLEHWDGQFWHASSYIPAG